MKKLLLICTAFLFMTGASFADNEALNWEGPYVGVNMGLGNGDMSQTDNSYDWHGSTIVMPDSSGFSGGFQMGYNWQFGRTVLGVEADYNQLDVESQIPYYDEKVALNLSIDSVFTFRVRTGFAVNNESLIFVTAGIAKGDVKGSWIEDGDPDNSFDDLGGNGEGWTVGAGIEQILSKNITMKLEGIYCNLGSYKGYDKENPPHEIETSYNVSIFRAGLNYKF